MYNKKSKPVQNHDKNDLYCNKSRNIKTSTSQTDKNPGYSSGIARWLDPDPKKTLMAFCCVLLVFWCIWWGVNFHKQKMQGGNHLWFSNTSYSASTFGCDFYRHIDHPARLWWNNIDPYGDKEIFFAYPPSEMRLFAWVNFMKPRTALGVWLIVMTLIITTAAWTANRWRYMLCLNEISYAAALVLILFSTPVLFAIERGQYDPLSLLSIMAALPFLFHSSRRLQYLAGAILCLAPWLKVYPSILFIGLIGLKRWRALAGFLVSGVILLAALNHEEIRGFIINNNNHIQWAESQALIGKGEPCLWNHPLPSSIASLWLNTKFSSWGLLPGKIIAAFLLSALLIWVTSHVYRCRRREALTYPYLLWIVALATFYPPVSNDYNLCFLPLAILAAWDRRDPLLVQVSLGLFMLYWQPVFISIPGIMLLTFKFFALCAVAVLLVERAGEQEYLADQNYPINKQNREVTVNDTI